MHRCGRDGGARRAHRLLGHDKAKTALRLATDRATAVRQAIHCCRKGGIVSIPGVYGGFIDKVPMGAAFSKGLTLKLGQTHVHKYCHVCCVTLRTAISIPRSWSHTASPLEQAPRMYRTFRDKQDGCVKVVLKPH